MRIVGVMTCWLVGFALSSCASVANNVTESQQQFAVFAECELTSGEVLAPCSVGYRTFGRLNSDKSNAILVPTWFTGTSADHAFLATPEVLDPAAYFIVIVDALANGVSVSPSNYALAPNEKFPAISIADMVSVQHRLLTETLEIRSLHAIVGLSMGGMQAFEWAVQFPGFSAKTVAAIGSPRLPSFDIALWLTRNQLLTWWRECQCQAAAEALAGFRLLSSVPTQLADEIGRDDTRAVISARATDDPLSLEVSWDQQRQAEAMIGHNIAREFDDEMVVVATHVQSEFLIVVSADDRVVTPQPAKDFAALTASDIVELDADCGHGDPWCAPDEFASAVKSFVTNER